MKYFFTLLLCLLAFAWSFAQESNKGKVTIKGQTYDYIIDDGGDTLIMAGLGKYPSLRCALSNPRRIIKNTANTAVMRIPSILMR